MAKIRFKKINTRNPLLFSTSVENLFISELLPAAPGEYVKVYLFGLMNAGFGGAEDIKVTSNVLNMPVEDIEKAWAYWEDKGAVQQVYDPETRSYRIDFISQIEEIFGTPMEEAKPAGRPGNPGIVHQSGGGERNADFYAGSEQNPGYHQYLRGDTGCLFLCDSILQRAGQVQRGLYF